MTRLEDRVPPHEQVCIVLNSLKPSNRHRYLTTCGIEGIVPFTEGFLPLLGGTKEGYTRTFRKVVTDEKAPTP